MTKFKKVLEIVEKDIKVHVGEPLPQFFEELGANEENAEFLYLRAQEHESVGTFMTNCNGNPFKGVEVLAEPVIRLTPGMSDKWNKLQLQFGNVDFDLLRAAVLAHEYGHYLHFNQHNLFNQHSLEEYFAINSTHKETEAWLNAIDILNPMLNNRERNEVELMCRVLLTKYYRAFNHPCCSMGDIMSVIHASLFEVSN